MKKTTTLCIEAEELRMIVIKHFGLNPGACEMLRLDALPEHRGREHFTIELECTEVVERPWEKGVESASRDDS